MAKQRFLNSKQVKEIHAIIEKQWGITEKIDYTFLKNDDNNIFIVNRDIAEIDLEKMRVNNIGLYIGELKGDYIRLSIEGSQIIGAIADKNIIEITREETNLWMTGNDLERKEDLGQNYVIIKNDTDFLGCGKCNGTKIFNFVPKIRRLNAIVEPIQNKKL
jgi:NOL1/NOP2/fmu family ribosome biogenesis protein